MSALKITTHAVILFVAIGVAACKSSSAPEASSAAAAISSTSSSSPSSQSQSGSAPTTQKGVLPKGFQSYNDPQGSGRVVFAKFTGGARSASGAMREFLSYMNGYFDAPPQFLGAVNDAQDRVVQAVWRGSLGGQPIRGAATVVIGKTDAVFAMLFDRPQSFATSYKRLALALGPQMPRSANGNGQISMTPDQNWQRQTAGDGSAAAFVPQGWRVTGCANGALDIVGPNKQAIELGLAYPIFSTPMPGSKPGSVVPFLNPAQAIMLLESNLNYNQLQSTPASYFGRLIETTPIPWQNGQAMYALQEVNNNNMGHRKALILIGTSGIVSNEWLLYTSYASAEANTFDEDLPVMLKIWGSWKVNDSVYQERMKQALASMKETNAIITSMHDYQSKVYDDTNYAMDMVIRGNWPVENTETGARIEVSQNMATELEKQCQERGIPCRQVPINQLTGH
jgi:hypothetical protein